jgi:hypothetical protein
MTNDPFTTGKCTTEEEHYEVSQRLALAIGWPQVLVFRHGVCVREQLFQDYKLFDYRDPAVIWPIAEWFIFPVKCNARWRCWLDATHSVVADTAPLAVALAVVHLEGVTLGRPPT